MDLEDDKMAREDDSTSVMIGEVNVADAPNPRDVVFTDEKSWTVDELLAFVTLLDFEKAAIQDKVAKGELNVPKKDKGK